MNRFLSVILTEEAVRIVRQIALPLPVERIPLSDAIGRVTARDVSSDVDIPGFSRSTVDGYAVRSPDTTGAGESIPSILKLTGRISMGETDDKPLEPGTCMYIPTGASLPQGADAVVMVEYCEEPGDQVLIHRPVSPGENIISRGEDFGSGQVAVYTGTRISSRVAGVLAACGLDTVPVSVRPRIGIISTGDELVPIQGIPEPGQIRDINSWLCAGFVTEQGGIPVMYGIIRDERESLAQAFDAALESCDTVLISGGSSKGERDMCAEIISSRGEVHVHGIAISPGKPTIIGISHGKPVIGLPGHPSSAYVILLVLVRELVKRMTGQNLRDTPIFARLKTPLKSVQGREDYVRAVLEGDYVIPVLGKSGLTNTLLHSDGIIRIPGQVEGYEAGDKVEVILW
ncbi:MAG: molybdopterin molybdotransferase MoeA [Methanospirillum sp.]|nr:molybdopterin molybdotransferase MoeA [Methanospirillum sp.]